MEVDALPESERFAYFRGWIANYPNPDEKTVIMAVWGVMQSIPTPVGDSKEQVVVLLHGIRTAAEWQGRVAEELKKLVGVTVMPIQYGWVDAIRFFLPRSFGTRNQPLTKVLRELRDIKFVHDEKELVVVAHSFSTYLITCILEENPDLKVNKLLLCGSIVPLDYRWDKLSQSNNGMVVVNDVGTQDMWPILARLFSWGYGPSGTLGFGTARVSDRFFQYGHSDFFVGDHVTKYWASFVESGEIVESPWSSSRGITSSWVGLISGMPFPKVIVAGLIFLGYLLFQKALIFGFSIFGIDKFA